MLGSRDLAQVAGEILAELIAGRDLPRDAFGFRRPPMR